MPLGSGRKNAEEWKYVIRTTDSDKAVCKSCNKEISCKIERIRSHLDICSARNTANQNSECEQGDGIDQDYILDKRNKYRNIKDFATVTTEKQKDILDDAIAKFFFANNIAFNIAENKYFKTMIEQLRIGYEPPSRKQLAEKHLFKVDKEITDSLKTELNDATLTLVLDGWTNSSNSPIIAFSISTGKKSFLINADDPASDKKTAEFCLEATLKVIENIKTQYGKNIFAVCTDNEPKMKKMRRILEEKIPIVTYGCSAHFLNLLYKDIVPEEITSKIVIIHKYFRNHHIPKAWLKEKGGITPTLPNDVRWNSYENCVETFTRNFHLYTQIRTEKNQIIESNVNDILAIQTLYNDALMLLQVLTILKEASNQLQDETTSIATSVEIWYNLLNNPALQTHRNEIENRMYGVLTPIHFLANMMDPRYMGQKLSEDAERIAEEYVSKKHPAFLPFCMLFKIKDQESFPCSMFVEDVISKVQAEKWWQIMKKKTARKNILPAGFCEYFTSLMACPASSASIERIFSSYGLIWNKLRNRLGFDKALALVKIYHNLRTELQEW